MRILFLDAYFYPEQIAFSHLENDLLEGFINNGHRIEVLCPVPTRGIDYESIRKYKRIKEESLYNNYVHVTRFSAPQERKNPLIRALRYFWCNLRTYQIGIRYKEIDAVFSNSTPPTQGWIAGKVAKRLNVPFVYSLQDVFPDSLVTTGLTKQGSILWNIGRELEKTTYKLCTHIIVISKSMKENLVLKDVDEQKIDIVSNWIDPKKIAPVNREKNTLFDEFGISRNKFIVLYAGNFGAAQGAEIVLDVAERLKSINSIQFVIFGGGSGFPQAEQRAKDYPNVFIHKLLPQDRVSEVYSMGDVALITCKKGVGKSGMPSKTWNIMACNTPIIASFDKESELNDVLLNSELGYCIEPENCDELEKTILSYFQGKVDKTDALHYIHENASKDVCVGRILSIFENVVNTNE